MALRRPQPRGLLTLQGREARMPETFGGPGGVRTVFGARIGYKIHAGS